MTGRATLKNFPLSRLERYLLSASWFPLHKARKPTTLLRTLGTPQVPSGVKSQLSAAPGHSIQLIALPEGESCWVTLSTEHTASTDDNPLSIWSPLGQALLGKTCGDLVQVKVFRRTLTFIVGDILRVKQTDRG